VNHVSIPGPDGLLRTLATSSHGIPGAPVSNVRLGDEILPVVEEAASLLGDSEVSELLRESYRPGETLGTAFARFYARLFSQWGVILLDASDAELHRVAAPIYRTAIERAEDLEAGLLARGQALESAGYYQQVKVTESSVLLFTLREGARTPIHRREGANHAVEFVISGETGAEKLSSAELLDRIAAAPENFSPNVLLRPVVQDYLLPTLAYTGGVAEAAYFAQVGAVYEKIMGRVTPIVPRSQPLWSSLKCSAGWGSTTSQCGTYSTGLSRCARGWLRALCQQVCRLPSNAPTSRSKNLFPV